MRKRGPGGDADVGIHAPYHPDSPPVVPVTRRVTGTDHRSGIVGSSLIVNVEDLESVRAFYGDIVGLRLEKSWQAPEGSGIIFELSPLSTIEFASPPYAERRDRTPATGLELMIQVDDAVAWRDRLREAGVRIERGLRENPWGDRSFGIADPSGMRVWIFERIGVPSL